MVISLKNLLRLIGILFLLCFSFIITDKTVYVVKEFDDIMIELKDKSEQYYEAPKEAVLKGDTLIPGMHGRELDLDRSYSKMRRYGKFEESLIELKEVYPKIRWEGYYDKYIIGGNKEKNMVSFLFLVNNKKSLIKILEILDQKNIKATFFIDGNWLEHNMKEIGKIIQEGHELGNLGYNQNYENYVFLWVNNTIKKISNQNYQYCYVESKDKKILDACKLHKHYTIYPSIKLNKNYYSNIKKKIKPGSFIALKVTNELEEKLPYILNYTISKGYKIDTLETHLKE